MSLGGTVAGLMILPSIEGCAGPLFHVRPDPLTGDNRKRIVIIGSGITGLCSGALLARMGHRVVVLERHPEFVGGHARSFDIQGLRFCAGPQYVWDFHGNLIGPRVLRYLGLDRDNPFDPMDPDGFERMIVGRSAPFDVPVGIGRFRTKMKASFPEDARGLDRFFDWLDDLYHGTTVIFREALYLKDGAGMSSGVFVSPEVSLGVKLRMLQVKALTLADLFDRSGLPPHIRRILYGHGGVFAENESRISAVLYGGATGHYHAGASYPRHGFDRMIDGMCSVIREQGGSVETGKEVSELVRGEGGVTAVRCADGSSHPCDLVISSISPRLTCRLLDVCTPNHLTYQPSNSLLACFIGTDLPGLEGRLARRNIWWQNGNEVDYDAPDMTVEPGMLYVGSPSANQSVPGRDPAQPHAVVVFAPGNFRQAKEAFDRGPEAHDRLRDQIRDQVLGALDRYVLPGLTEHLRFAVVHTPWDVYQQTGAESGNVYGRKLDAAAMLAGIGTVEFPSNLAVACASTGIPGIASCFQTAAVLVRELTGVAI